MFRDLGLTEGEEVDATRNGPWHIGPDTVFGTLSKTSEPFCMGEGMWSVLIFAAGDPSTDFAECGPECDNSGVVGVEGGSVA